jgi:beta-glucosidase-like glycosyl hydrolase/CubicO group peptidase (beta-lactamase class C family)
MNKLLIFLVFLISGQQLFSQPIKPPFYQFEKDHWVDSVFNSLSLDEKIGQLIMIPAFPKKGKDHLENLISQVKENKIGGIIVMKGGPMKEVQLINRLQAASSVPLLVAMDAEWGLTMRVDSTIRYPYAMALGAVNDDSLLFNIGADIAKQCKRIGVNINFAPVADVNSNSLNPVIGYRSFGDDPENVAHKATLLSLGMQSQKVLPTLKHFPGEGDTDKDSHFSLPVISHSRNRLNSVELIPFRESIKNGAAGVMTAHLSIPALDSTMVPASLSKQVIKDLLIKELGFRGLIVTDAMNMQGIADQVKNGSAEVMALAAGNDMMEFILDPAKSISAIKKGIEEGKISIQDIDAKCRKILMIKRWAGLDKYHPVSMRNLLKDLNQSSYRMTLRNAVQKSLTVIQNKNELIPLKRLDTLKIAAVSLGSERISTFQNSLGRYKAVAYFNIGKNAGESTIQKTLYQLRKFNLVIVGIDNLGVNASDKYNLSDSQTELTRKIAAQNKSVFVIFGNPYVLNYMEGIERANSIIVAYQETYETLDLSGQLIFGAFGSEGRLPFKLKNFPNSSKPVKTVSLDRFKYTLPEEVGIDSTYLKNRIDSLINLGLKEKAFPGCQIFLAKNGKVFFNQCYGYHTYQADRLVQPDDLYDFASLTKIMAPLPAIMKLYDEKKLNISKKVSDYWPSWKSSNKQNLVFTDVLSHQARLQPWIPFWRQTIDKQGRFKPGIFSKDSSDVYSLHVSKNLFLKNSYPDSVYSTIRNSSLLRQKKYVYSDLGFMIFPRVIENISKENYEHFIKTNFYDRLGASTLTYRPYLYFPIDRLVPTEDDEFFRHEQLQGFVHDEGAAMLGGISGNAGLFGNVNDAAKMMQMYLNYGEYGGERFISESTLKDWTQPHFGKTGNRRAYGFDKPVPNNNSRNVYDAYPSPLSSNESFGHSGYTGTFAWADPKSGMLYLFFTNRVYPTRENNKLNQLKLRILLQQTAYESLKPGEIEKPRILLASTKSKTSSATHKIYKKHISKSLSKKRKR